MGTRRLKKIDVIPSEKTLFYARLIVKGTAMKILRLVVLAVCCIGIWFAASARSSAAQLTPEQANALIGGWQGTTDAPGIMQGRFLRIKTIKPAQDGSFVGSLIFGYDGPGADGRQGMQKFRIVAGTEPEIRFQNVPRTTLISMKISNGAMTGTILVLDSQVEYPVTLKQIDHNPCGKFTLVMFERDDCPFCKAWHKSVGPAYEMIPEGRLAPIRSASFYIPPKDLSVDRPVETPTFILMEDRAEIDRWAGFAGPEQFWQKLRQSLAKAGAPVQSSN